MKAHPGFFRFSYYAERISDSSDIAKLRNPTVRPDWNGSSGFSG